MKIKRQKLIDVLEIVQPGLGKEGNLQQVSSFVFKNGFVMTYNDEITIRHPIDLDIKGAIQAKEFYSLLKKIKDKEVEIKQTKNELLVKGKRSKAGIKLVSKIHLPIEDIGDQDNWLLIPDTLLPALQMAIPISSKDMSREALTAINIKGRYTEASDGFRIIRIDLGKKAKKLFKEAVQLPATAAKSLCQYPITKFAVSPGWCHFGTDNETIFSCRTIAEKFPDIEPFLKVDGPKLKLPKNMKEILERAGIFAKADTFQDEEVRVSIKGNKMTIRGEGNYGWLEEKAKCQFGGKSIEFVISPVLLYDILENLRHCIVGENSLKFEGENFEHVVCLIDLD